MNQPTQALEHASVRQYCKALRMPVLGANFVRLSEQAIKEQRTHIGYLEALLAMEAEERDRHAIQKRIRDAKLPRLKTLEEFDFNQARQIPAAKIRELAEGGYIERAEPIVFHGQHAGRSGRAQHRECAAHAGAPDAALADERHGLTERFNHHGDQKVAAKLDEISGLRRSAYLPTELTWSRASLPTIL